MISEIGPRPQCSILSDDSDVTCQLRAIAEALGVDVGREITAAVAGIVDPAVGPAAIEDHLDGLGGRGSIAVIRRPHHAAASLVALRMSRGVLVEDPRRDPDGVATFLRDAFGLPAGREERRAYPRATATGVALVAPAGGELLDLSPYGARLRIPGDGAWLAEQPVFTLDLRLEQLSLTETETVTCQVADARIDGSGSDVNLRFVDVNPVVQRELFKIAKSQLLSTTILETFHRLEHREVDGFRWIVARDDVGRALRGFAASKSTVTVARMHRGRVVQTRVADVDAQRRHLRLTPLHPEASGPVGTHLVLATTWDHESFLFDGFVLGNDADGLVMSLPNRCLVTDRRAQVRLDLGLGSALGVRLGSSWHPVADLSSRGISFYAKDAAEVPAREGTFELVIDLGHGRCRTERALLRHVTPRDGALLIGAMLVDDHAAGARPVAPMYTEEATLPLQSPRVTHELTSSDPIRFRCGDRNVAGLWNEVRHPGPATVFIVPPAWGKTKESVAILAQFLCAMFDANRRHVAVLRIDYVNALGESDKDPPFRIAGKETLGLELSECVANLTAAIGWAHERLERQPDVTALIGMSFSGPVCLRAAAIDPRVTHLVQLMGASDLQDLIRTASGGIDYIANYRAGVRHQVRNILGVLSDADRWCADGMRHGLLLVQDAQCDAARLRVPVLWVHGRYDAFVNEERIRSILAAAATVERRLVVVPCGHVPTKSHEALLAYAPVATFALASVGVRDPIVAVPDERRMAEIAAAEWARAPRTELAAPRNYWRSYMLGEDAESMGFDVLAMTREYHDMMARQLDLCDLRPGTVVADVGCGLGHALAAIEARPEVPGLEVLLFDLVPQLLEEARRRATRMTRIETCEWDADATAPPISLARADVVLMSLFLSCLGDPDRFLLDLSARLRKGARVVASTFTPDADLSQVYMNLLRDIRDGRVTPPDGRDVEQLIEAVRDYMSSAAFLLRLFDEGRFRFFEAEELATKFEAAGFEVREIDRCFGAPPRAVILCAHRR